MTTNRPYPWTQADRTPEIDQLAQDAGEAQADREVLADDEAKCEHCCGPLNDAGYCNDDCTDEGGLLLRPIYHSLS